MPNIQQFQYLKNKKKNYSSVSAESFAAEIFQQAFRAPFTSIEQGQTDLKPAFQIVDISAYLCERVVKAWGKIEESDLEQGSDYVLAIDKEREKLEKLFQAGRMTESIRDAKLNYFKLALILEKIQEGKGKAEELEV